MTPMDCHTVRSAFPQVLFAGDLTWPHAVAPRLLLDAELSHEVTVVPNLEGPLLVRGTTKHHRRGVTCGLWSGQGVRDLLTCARVEVAGVANNHLCDFPGGAGTTLEELRRSGIVAGGAGATAAEAERPVRIVLRDGTSVAILFLGDWRVGCVPPSRGRAGVNTLSESASCAAIRRLRSGYPTDIVVASVHAGEELQPSPAPHVRRWLRALARAGADVVLGHHPHVRYGAERVGTSWVFYSLGNLLMGGGPYDGITLSYPPEAEMSFGVMVGSQGVRVVRMVADASTGIVRQEGPPVSPEAEMSAGFTHLMSLDDTEYVIAYRRARSVSWWYPLWTGSESFAHRMVKASWLRTVQVARGLMIRRKLVERGTRD